MHTISIPAYMKAITMFIYTYHKSIREYHHAVKEIMSILSTDTHYTGFQHSRKKCNYTDMTKLLL